MYSIELSGFEEALQGLAIRGIIVIQDNKELLHKQYVPETFQNQYSVTKSFTATAAAFAMEKGLFSLEDEVLMHFAKEAPDEPSENLQKMKIEHLLTMSMGFEAPMLMGDSRKKLKEKDWVRYCLSQKVVCEPGKTFLYNNAGPYLLGVLIQKKTGMDLIEYLTPLLFKPICMSIPEPERDPMGYVFGAGGMKMTLTDLSKFGVFYLNRGVVSGKRLLPETWFFEVSKEHIHLKEMGDNEIGRGYGYLFWTMPDGMYRADGKFGQYCIIAPRKRAVIAVNSMEEENAQAILRAVVRHILPQL